MSAMQQVRALARYQTHGGYAWAAVMGDGELLCTPCVRDNYRQIVRDTKGKHGSGWRCIGLANSGESETTESCCHCERELWAAP
jgi:hypothetical protein